MPAYHYYRQTTNSIIQRCYLVRFQELAQLWPFIHCCWTASVQGTIYVPLSIYVILNLAYSPGVRPLNSCRFVPGPKFCPLRFLISEYVCLSCLSVCHLLSVCILYYLLIFTALHGMQTRSCDEISVCLSVRLSVKRVHCDKTEEKSVQIFIPCERSFSLVL